METSPDYVTKPGSAPRALLLMLGAAAGIAFFIYRLINSFATGTVPGKLGAVHHAPSMSYYVGVAALLIGIALGCALLRMSWGWLKHNRP